MREPVEYVTGHVPGAVSMPVESVPARLRELPADRPVYVICASGNRSSRVAAYLAEAAFEAHSVDGGTQAWIAAGHPVVTGPRADRV